MSTAEGDARSGYLDDRQQLHKLGYAQELYRSMGGFQNFAISFTIISILAGCLTSYYIAFNQGGPIAVTWGWLLVGGFLHHRRPGHGRDRLDYPTAGGALLLGVKARRAGLGLVHRLVQPRRPDRVTAAIGYGCAVFTTSLLNLWLPDYPNTDPLDLVHLHG